MLRFLVVAAFALIVSAGSLLWSAPAQAQATRTWVSGVGDDANPCSRTAPCKTFAGAISKTATFGEINCLDSGGFGGVTITKSITISCPHVEAGVLVSGTSGIVINLPADSDRVMLEYLDIEGLTTGINGVNMVGRGNVLIKDCVIRGFASTGAGGGNGVRLAGLANARVVLMNSTITNNRCGIVIDGAAGAVNAANIVDNMFDKNTDFAVKVGATGQATISGNFMAASTSSLLITPGGAVLSYQNNVLRNPGLPTLTDTLK